MNKGKLITTGKTKSLYATNDESLVVMEFRDDTTALDGERMQQLSNKGRINSSINAFIMQHLRDSGIATHFVEQIDQTHALVKSLAMIPLESVVRNRAAGSLTRRLGIEKGRTLSPPIFEFFIKNDELHDPMVNRSHAITFDWATSEQMRQMEEISLKVNHILTDLFSAAGMLLVDYKLEFGIDNNGNLLLGDEFSPDGCRIWDSETEESLDKDRFRQELGDVVESYQIVAERLGIYTEAEET